MELLQIQQADWWHHCWLQESAFLFYVENKLDRFKAVSIIMALIKTNIEKLCHAE